MSLSNPDSSPPFEFASFDKQIDPAVQDEDYDGELPPPESTGNFQLLDFSKINTLSVVTDSVAEDYPFPSFDILNDSDESERDREISLEIREKLKDAEEKMLEANQKLQESEQILIDTRQKAVEIESNAYQEGYSKGFKSGYEETSQKMGELIQHLENIISDIAAYKKDFPKVYEKEVIALIRLIAEKVIRINAKLDHRVVMENIFAAFDILADRVEVKISINPEDLDFVNDHRPEFFTRVKGLQSITIEGDPDISRGGCHMETQYGDVDARIATQIQRIEEAFESLLG